MRPESLRDLAPLAALGALDGEEAGAFAEAAATSSECRLELEAFERVVGLIALAERRVSPPSALRRRIVSAVFPDSEGARPHDPERA